MPAWAGQGVVRIEVQRRHAPDDRRVVAQWASLGTLGGGVKSRRTKLGVTPRFPMREFFCCF